MATKSKQTTKKTTAKTSARRPVGTVKKRGWSLNKFSERVTAAAVKQEIPKKAIKAGVLEKAYNDGLTVRAAVAKIAA